MRHGRMAGIWGLIQEVCCRAYEEFWVKFSSFQSFPCLSTTSPGQSRVRGWLAWLEDTCTVAHVATRTWTWDLVDAEVQCWVFPACRARIGASEILRASQDSLAKAVEKLAELEAQPCKRTLLAHSYVLYPACPYQEIRPAFRFVTMKGH